MFLLLYYGSYKLVKFSTKHKACKHWNCKVGSQQKWFVLMNFNKIRDHYVFVLFQLKVQISTLKNAVIAEQAKNEKLSVGSLRKTLKKKTNYFI